jgi:ubiquinone/menaquinone biosynthesis C-methylase UbiE
MAIQTFLQEARPGAISEVNAVTAKRHEKIARGRRIDRYGSFIAAFQSPQGMQAMLRRSHLLRAGLRVLDAGWGFGMVTFAFLETLRERDLDYETIDAFDLAPAMLARFHSELETRGITPVQLQQAVVLALETLPLSWTNYDLIISASMLE